MIRGRPVLLQLWTVRDQLKEDFSGSLNRIRELGFAGVEPFNWDGLPLEHQAQALQSAGLSCPAAHLPLPAGESLQASLEAAEALGVSWIVSGFGPEGFSDQASVARTARLAEEAARNARQAGYGFALHNHWWEFQGQPPVWEEFSSQLSPLVRFEIDTYWAQVAGRDPARLLHELGPRAPLIHLKDGSAVQGEAMLALGDGVMDIPGILQASQAELLVIELDEHDGDMWNAVARSNAYLQRLAAAGA